MAGTARSVLRIVPVAALVPLVAAACGGSARPHRSAVRGVPRVLAREWAARATAVADAAAAGNSCRATRLAHSLRDEVIAGQSKLPQRLESPLVAGVNALADRLVCKVPAQTMTVAPAHPPKPAKPAHKPKKPHGPGPHGHGAHGKKP